MKTRFSWILALLLATIAAFAALVPAQAGGRAAGADRAPLPPFFDFVSSVTDGMAGVVRGVYAPGQFALPVVQQPEGSHGYVSREPGVVTQYGPAAWYGTIGLLAHNYLAGAGFASLPVGQMVWIVYGDGRVAPYRVARVHRYQGDASAAFLVNLADNRQVAASDVFQTMYAGGGHVTFQTCIAAEGNNSWGLLFVVAMPYAGREKFFPR